MQRMQHTAAHERDTLPQQCSSALFMPPGTVSRRTPKRRTCQSSLLRSARSSGAVPWLGSSTSRFTAGTPPGRSLRSTPTMVREWPSCWKYSGGFPAAGTGDICSVT